MLSSASATALTWMLAVSSGAGLAAAEPPQRPPHEWSGVVTWVSDGDTLWIAPAHRAGRIKVRLEGIDAPELCQPGGPAARDALRARSLSRRVRVSMRRLDDYGRQLARVSVDREDLGAWMVSQGFAWSYGFRRDPGPYIGEERAARRATRGLFADPAAINPRAFRKSHGPCR